MTYYEEYENLSVNDLGSQLAKAVHEGVLPKITWFLEQSPLKGDVNLDHLLYMATERGFFDVVKYLLTGQKLIEINGAPAYINANDSESFIVACKEGWLDIVRYMLTSEDIVAHGGKLANIGAQDHLGLIQACQHGHLAIVKYLLSSPEIIQAGGCHATISANMDAAFRKAYLGHKEHVLNYLIFEAQIPLSSHINSFIFNRPEIKSMFERRALNQLLQSQLDEKEMSNKRTKV